LFLGKGLSPGGDGSFCFVLRGLVGYFYQGLAALRLVSPKATYFLFRQKIGKKRFKRNHTVSLENLFFFDFLLMCV